MSLAVFTLLSSLLLSPLEIFAEEVIDNQKVEEEAQKKVGIQYYKKYVYESKISASYRKGEYLIYDCISKHFVCVNKKNYEDCRSKMETAIDLRDFNKVCLPVKKFKDQRECFDKHYASQEKSRMSIFCETGIKK